VPPRRELRFEELPNGVRDVRQVVVGEPWPDRQREVVPCHRLGVRETRPAPVAVESRLLRQRHRVVAVAAYAARGQMSAQVIRAVGQDCIHMAPPLGVGCRRQREQPRLGERPEQPVVALRDLPFALEVAVQLRPPAQQEAGQDLVHPAVVPERTSLPQLPAPRRGRVVVG